MKNPFKSSLLTFAALTFMIGVTLSSCSQYQQSSAPNPVADSLVETNDITLPQIYFHAKAFYSQKDLTDLQNKVITPLAAHYKELNQEVVAILVDNEAKDSEEKNEFYFSVIIDNKDGNQDPIYYGFVHSKVEGEIPEWQPEVLPEGYQG